MSCFAGWLLGRSGSPDEPDAELGPFPCVPRPLGPGCGSSKILVLLSLMKKEFFSYMQICFGEILVTSWLSEMCKKGETILFILKLCTCWQFIKVYTNMYVSPKIVHINYTTSKNYLFCNGWGKIRRYVLNCLTCSCFEKCLVFSSSLQSSLLLFFLLFHLQKKKHPPK